MCNWIPKCLRKYLNELNAEYATKANALWQIAKPLHEHQNRPDNPNENGRVHIRMVEHNIYRFLNDSIFSEMKHLEQLETHEVFILSAAACCHDFDKAQKNLPNGFIHGQRSGEIVVQNADRLGLTRPEAEAVCAAIEIHDIKGPTYASKLNDLDLKYMTSIGPINLRKVALLLKVADTLHTDNSRISTWLTNEMNLQGIARKKYLARYCINGWGIDGTRVVIQANPGNTEQQSALYECFEYMKKYEWSMLVDNLKLMDLSHELVLKLRGNGYQKPPILSIGPNGDNSVTIILTFNTSNESATDQWLSDKMIHLSAKLDITINSYQIVQPLPNDIVIVSITVSENAAKCMHEIAKRRSTILLNMGIIEAKIGATNIRLCPTEDNASGTTTDKMVSIQDFILANKPKLLAEIIKIYETREDDFWRIIHNTRCNMARINGANFINKVDSLIDVLTYNEEDQVLVSVFNSLAHDIVRGAPTIVSTNVFLSQVLGDGS